MSYFWYIFFGLVPSIIWLLFFLRKDANPESKRMILKIFFYGILATLPIISFWIIVGTIGLTEAIREFFVSSILIYLLYAFIGVALVEEVLKYLVVKDKVLKDPEFDEPTDAMLYMIIAALGFAAAENLLNFFIWGYPVFETFLLGIVRFALPTFLHALCSGLVGYYLALSLFDLKNRFKLIGKGLLIAMLLHGIFNFSIMEIGGNAKFIVPIIILVYLAIFVSLGFKKVKKLKSVCKI